MAKDVMKIFYYIIAHKNPQQLKLLVNTKYDISVISFNNFKYLTFSSEVVGVELEL